MNFIQMMDLNNLNLPEKWPQLITLAEKNIIGDEGDLIKKVDSMQTSLFYNVPSLGAYRWFIVEIIRLPGNYIGVRMEDGHKENYALLNYIDSGDKLFTVIEALG